MRSKKHITGAGRISSTGAILLALIVVLASVAAILYYIQTTNSEAYPLSKFAVEKIQISNPENGSVITGLVYVASSSQEQIQGFQNVTSFGDCNGLSTNQSTKCIGMIFVTGSTQNLCFWMHNTPLPLQQIWISSGGSVVYIYEAHPESDNTICKNAQDVLETSPGESISVGDSVQLTRI